MRRNVGKLAVRSAVAAAGVVALVYAGAGIEARQAPQPGAPGRGQQPAADADIHTLHAIRELDQVFSVAEPIAEKYRHELHQTNTPTLLYLILLLHDIGKMYIDERTLNKPGKLTPIEFKQVMKHESPVAHSARTV